MLVAADVDRQRKIYKALQKSATIVEFWGLRASRDARVDLRDAARTAEQLVRKAVGDAGQQIDPAAAKLIAQRAGTDIARLRGDVDRLLLYAAGKPKISLQDVQEVVSGETSQDDWAVTNAISRGDTAEALRQLGLALDAGGVSYQILGQLAWFVREKFPSGDPKRVRPAVEALFRTDLDLKSSGGDPRVLLERLVVELCRPLTCLRDASREPGLVAGRRVPVDDLLGGHLVDQRDRVAERVFHLRGISGVDRCADVAQRATETSSHLPIPVALDNILTVRFERRGVTCQCVPLKLRRTLNLQTALTA